MAMFADYKITAVRCNENCDIQSGETVYKWYTQEEEDDKEGITHAAHTEVAVKKQHWLRLLQKVHSLFLANPLEAHVYATLKETRGGINQTCVASWFMLHAAATLRNSVRGGKYWSVATAITYFHELVVACAPIASSLNCNQELRQQLGFTGTISSDTILQALFLDTLTPHATPLRYRYLCALLLPLLHPESTWTQALMLLPCRFHNLRSVVGAYRVPTLEAQFHEQLQALLKHPPKIKHGFMFMHQQLMTEQGMYLPLLEAFGSAPPDAPVVEQPLPQFSSEIRDVALGSEVWVQLHCKSLWQCADTKSPHQEQGPIPALQAATVNYHTLHARAHCLQPHHPQVLDQEQQFRHKEIAVQDNEEEESEEEEECHQPPPKPTRRITRSLTRRTLKRKTVIESATLPPEESLRHYIHPTKRKPREAKRNHLVVKNADASRKRQRVAVSSKQLHTGAFVAFLKTPGKISTLSFGFIEIPPKAGSVRIRPLLPHPDTTQRNIMLFLGSKSDSFRIPTRTIFYVSPSANHKRRLSLYQKKLLQLRTNDYQGICKHTHDLQPFVGTVLPTPTFA